MDPAYVALAVVLYTAIIIALLQRLPQHGPAVQHPTADRTEIVPGPGDQSDGVDAPHNTRILPQGAR